MIELEQLNASIRQIPIPPRMRMRPVSGRGYPVPFFVTQRGKDGDWDFRVISPATVLECMRRSLCWLCGQPLGQFKAFTAGPMCVATRTSAEPPSHVECSQYAARACPFLAQPRMVRNEADMPEGHWMLGIGITRNPGVAAVYVTKDWMAFRDGKGGVLIRMGDPVRVEWYAERRAATRAEVLASVDSGAKILIEKSPASEREEIVQSLVRLGGLIPRE